MIANHIYYQLKPFIPLQLRFMMRRFFARRKLKLAEGRWPIDESAGARPAGWPGWPDGKKFAFVLSHDVEGPIGLGKCRQLADFENALGFRSAFNFVPEGSYKTPETLRSSLKSLGFEVGIHDLHHDGKLYRNERVFAVKAERINHYLQEWGATGFRSGFMLRNLEWIHQLDITYDSSTFDTDPFEPQCDGTGTIFPFWIPAPSLQSGDIINSAERNGGAPKGYLELPYTLPQDSTLFLVLEEKTPEIWFKKLDWVAEHGGMALVNVHPDYLQFDPARHEPHTFPVQLYRDLLDYVNTKYAGLFWHATPGEVADFATGEMQKLSPNSAPKIKIQSK